MKRPLESFVTLVVIFLVVLAVLITIVGGPILLSALAWYTICAIGHVAFSWDIPVIIGIFITMAALMTV